MALIGCCGHPPRAADLGRVSSAVPRQHLWSGTHREGAQAVLGVMPDGASTLGGTQERASVLGGKAVDSAGRGLVLTGRLFDAPDFASRHHLPRHLSEAALAAAWLERHSNDSMAAALDALEGDYTLARWDPKTGTLLLAASPMSSRTLYWHHSPHGTWFASSLALLFRFPSVPRTPSVANIAAHVALMVLDPADTVFEQVRHVPQGSLVWAGAEGIREGTIWRPDPAKRLRYRRDDDYVEAARDLLDSAVRKRLQGARPPAVTVTGGLDSSGLAATAARQLGDTPLDTYTAVPAEGSAAPISPTNYADERPSVEDLARRYPSLRPHFCVSTELAAFERDPTPLFLAGGRSVISTSHLGWFDPLYKAVQAHGHSSVMVGTMGNFTLSFDEGLIFSDMLRRGRLLSFLRLFPKVMGYRGRRARDHLIPAIGRAWPEARAVRRRLLGRNNKEWKDWTYVRPDLLNRIDLEGLADRWGEEGIITTNPDSRVQRAHFLHNRWTRQVEILTTLRAYYGLDLIDPFADRALAEFCLAIPPEQYVIDGRSRSLARRVLADRLPPRLIDEPRRGQQNGHWFARLSQQKDIFAADLEQMERIPLVAGILDLPRLKSLIDRWPADAQEAHARRLQYQTILSQTMQIGRFLRWVDGGNES
ncbi:asparagine synthase-related protein [Novispirillum sp. DQ9]